MSMEWNSLQRRAKALEAQLEGNVQRYSSVAQKIQATFSDEENPLLESKEEDHLSVAIQRDLEEMGEVIASMRQCQYSSPSPYQSSALKRYEEIHYDLMQEFKHTAASVLRKRESMELLHHSHSTTAEDSNMQRLLRERNTIASALRGVQEVISNAFETKSSLSSQRSSLSGSNTGIGSITSSIPSFNRLIDGIQKKKYRESLIVACVVAVLLCFCIW